MQYICTQFWGAYDLADPFLLLRNVFRYHSGDVHQYIM